MNQPRDHCCFGGILSEMLAIGGWGGVNAPRAAHQPGTYACFHFWNEETVVIKRLTIHSLGKARNLLEHFVSALPTTPRFIARPFLVD